MYGTFYLRDVNDYSRRRQAFACYRTRGPASLDMLGDTLGKPAITKNQYKEIADHYDLQSHSRNYESYYKFRKSIQEPFWTK